METLERLADTLPTGRASDSEPPDKAFDVSAWLKEHNLEVARHGEWDASSGTGYRWILQVCPFNEEHTNLSAVVLRHPSGALSFKCHHNGCAGNHWHALRDLVEPGWREHRLEERLTKAKALVTKKVLKPKTLNADAALAVEVIDAILLLKVHDLATYAKVKQRFGRERLVKILEQALKERSEQMTRQQRPSVGRGLPWIEVGNRPLDEIADEALDALDKANTPPAVFVRGLALVRYLTDEKKHPIIDRWDEFSLADHLSRVADFMLEGSSGPISKFPAPRVVKAILKRGTWPFPPLMSVVESPVLRPDGTVLDAPGYDAATGIIYAPAFDLKVPPIPEQPTAKDLKEAVDLIADLIVDLPFLDDPSWANALGLLLTVVMRSAIDGPIPLALLDKPKPGTGASLLGAIVALLAGGNVGLLSAPNSEDEWRKQITSLLLAGKAVIYFDNVEHKLHSTNLEKALTCYPHDWEDRRLSVNEIARAPQRAIWLATGNNLRVGAALVRRCFWIRQDARMDRPEKRDRTKFRHPDLKLYAQQGRGELLAALLTMARAWFAAGCPKIRVPTMGNFEAWSETIGSVLAFAGIYGFLGNSDEMRERIDDEPHEWNGFIATWFAAIGEKEVTAAELVREQMNVPEQPLREALPSVLESAFTSGHGYDEKQRSPAYRLGKALSKREDQVFSVDGSRFRLERVRRDRHAGATIWRVRELPAESGAEVPEAVPEDCTTWPSGTCSKCGAKRPRRRNSTGIVVCPACGHRGRFVNWRRISEGPEPSAGEREHAALGPHICSKDVCGRLGSAD